MCVEWEQRFCSETSCKWVGVFKIGWTNVTDAERLGFSATYTSIEKLKEAIVMVLEDRIFTIAVIGQELNVSQGLMYLAVYDSLGFHRAALCKKKFFLLSNWHNTKQVHVPISQYKTCTCTNITIQNMYMYQYHNTKRTSTSITIQNVYMYQYHNIKRTCTNITIQNMYMYQYHNTKHVHVPISQYKTRTCTSITIQNVHVPISQYKTRTCTIITIQNVHVTLGTVPVSQYKTCT